VSKTYALTGLSDRIASLDWRGIAAALDAHGCAVVNGLVAADVCAELTATYDVEDRFRSRIVMASHGFGRGEYKYFAYPLPPVVGELRASLYPPLATIAGHWNETMGIAVRYPSTLDEFLERCHRAGQTKPTPLVLRYGEGDYNCLHQDVYGEHLFPIQATVLLAAPGGDFTGGEFVLTEQRPRMQSRASSHFTSTGVPDGTGARGSASGATRARSASARRARWCTATRRSRSSPARSRRCCSAPIRSSRA